MFATRIMEEMQDLHILAFVAHCRSGSILQGGDPSWVPQWHRCMTGSHFDRVIDGRIFYDAAVGSELCCQGLAVAGVLHLRGLVFDVMSSHSVDFNGWISLSVGQSTRGQGPA